MNDSKVTRKLQDGKFIETVITTNELDLNAILMRKAQIQSRQAQIRTQIEQVKAQYDKTVDEITACDDMIAQLPPVTIE